MRKIIITLTVSIFITLIVCIGYLSIFGLKTKSFNNFVNNKVKNFNSNLSINIKDVFIKLNLSQASINITTKEASLNTEANPVKISNIEINMSIASFIKKENSIKKLKVISSENSIKDVTSLLNLMEYNLSRYIFYSQIKNGLITFKIDTQFDKKNNNDYTFNISGKVRDGTFNLIGSENLNNINFNFYIKDNLIEIKKLIAKYQNINLSSNNLKVVKSNKNTFSIDGDLETSKANINPKIIFRLANFQKDYLSDKDISIKTKNLFSFQINSNRKIKNLKVNSIINFDELYFNEKYQNIIFLKNGAINLKYQNSEIFAELLSKFSFIDQKNFNNDYKNNILKLSLKKQRYKNISIDGNLSNKKKLIDSKIVLNFLKLDTSLLSDKTLNIETDSNFKVEINENYQLKKYFLNSNIKIDKLTPNTNFNSLILLRNIKTDLIMENGKIKINSDSNYSFINEKYDNINDNNVVNLKLRKEGKSNSNVEIFFNTNNNILNTKEIKKILNVQSRFISDQEVKLNSNFFIDFSINKKFEIKNFKLRSDLDLDTLKIDYKSDHIKKYIENYQNKIILKQPIIFIEYSKDTFKFRLEGKYALRNKYNNVLFKVTGKKNDFEIYSLLDLDNCIININEIEYFKKSKIPSNLEILLNYRKKGSIIKKINYTENKNRISLNNLRLSEDLKIVKIEDIDLNFVNKNDNFNNLKIEKDLDNYKVTSDNYDVEKLLEILLKNNNSYKFSKFFKDINTTIKFDAERLLLEKNSYLNGFFGEIDVKNNELLLAKFDGYLNKTNKFSYSFRTTTNDQKITNIYIQKPRPFINNYKFIKGFEGGELKLNSLKIKNNSRSNLKIKNFKVKEVPVLAKILTLASLQGIADLLTGEGIRFVDFDMEFKTKNNLTEIDEMYAIGPAVSILMEGYIERDRMTSLRGTLVPATTINKTIAKIPLLGDILVGSKVGEGVFGVSFKIKGPPKNMKTTVNPIKTLTPRFITRTIENLKGN